jgi:hypothetical protein
MKMVRLKMAQGVGWLVGWLVGCQHEKQQLSLVEAAHFQAHQGTDAKKGHNLNIVLVPSL